MASDSSDNVHGLSATELQPADQDRPLVTRQMLAAALKAVEPFTEENGVLSTSVMRQAVSAALEAALLNTRRDDA